MEHILQVAFQFDDEAVKKRLEDQCFEEVVDRLTKEYKKVAARDYRFNGYDRFTPEDKKIENQFEQAVRADVLEAIESFCDKHKDEIIEAAAVKLADKLSRIKKAKEILNEL